MDIEDTEDRLEGYVYDGDVVDCPWCKGKRAFRRPVPRRHLKKWQNRAKRHADQYGRYLRDKGIQGMVLNHLDPTRSFPPQCLQEGGMTLAGLTAYAKVLHFINWVDKQLFIPCARCHGDGEMVIRIPEGGGQ